MNILEIVSGRGVNGAVIHTLGLCRELSARGHRVTLVCRPGAWIARELRNDRVNLVPSDLHRWPRDECRRIAALAAASAIDVVHTHMSRAHFFGVLLKWFVRTPVVATAHSCRLQPHWMFNDAVITVSESVCQFQRRYNRVSPTRLHVIRPFVDLARFAPPSARDRQLMRESFGFPDQVPVVGAVGSIFREKGIVELVRAFAVILQSVPAARLLLVGDGPDEYVAEVNAVVAELGIAACVVWAGRRDDVSAVMGTMDLLAVTSADESCPLVVAEAMSVGLPVVATNVGGMPESVLDGVTGFVVPVGKRQRFADVTVQLLRDPDLRRRFGAAGRSRALQCFSPAAQVDAVEALLVNVAQELSGG